MSTGNAASGPTIPGKWVLGGTVVAVAGGVVAHMLGLGSGGAGPTAVVAGTAGAAGVAAGGFGLDIAKEFATSTLERLGSAHLDGRDAAGSSLDIQINHDLHKLAADSLRLALLYAVRDNRDPASTLLHPTLNALAERVPGVWFEKVLKGEAVHGPTFNEGRYFELFRAGHATRGETPPVGTAAEWSEFLIEHGTRAVKGGLSDADALKIGEYVRLTYAAAARDTARRDFSESGRGYPALVLRLLGELCAGQERIVADLLKAGEKEHEETRRLIRASVRANVHADAVLLRVGGSVAEGLLPLQESIAVFETGVLGRLSELLGAVHEEGSLTRDQLSAMQATIIGEIRAAAEQKIERAERPGEKGAEDTPLQLAEAAAVVRKYSTDTQERASAAIIARDFEAADGLLAELRASDALDHAAEIKLLEGRRWYEAGQIDKAINPFRTAAALRPESHDALGWLASALVHARANTDHGASLREVEELRTRALKLARAKHPGDHPDVARSLNNLAYVWKTLGRAAEAEPVYVEALQMRRRLFKGDHPAVAMSLNNLAYVWEALGRAGEAEPMYVEALEMTRRLFEGDHPFKASSLNNLAAVRDTLGRAAEAEPVYVEALEMLKRLYPSDHPFKASSLNNLAAVWKTLGRTAEAEPMYVEALQMRRRLFEGDHPDVAQSLNNLAAVWEALGRAAEAEPVYVEALEMRRRLFESDHPDVASSLNNLAAVWQTLGRTGEAEPVYVEALEMFKRLYPGDHPLVAGSLNNLAYVRAVQGRWAEALEPSEQAVAMAGRCMPEAHPSRVQMEQNLAAIRAKLGGA